jgi:AhpD family alkylhydroperoxidase
MNEKITELIAIGASHAVNCHPCMEFHKKAALEAGATEEEMRAAAQVGEQVKNGAARITREKSAALFGVVSGE